MSYHSVYRPVVTKVEMFKLEQVNQKILHYKQHSEFLSVMTSLQDINAFFPSIGISYLSKIMGFF